MADSDDRIKISELPSALSMDNTDDLVVDQGMAGARTTKRVSASVLGSHITEVQQNSNLETTNKTIIGAINELNAGGGGGGGGSWTDISGTLLAGQTSITISSASILADSFIQVFTHDGTDYNTISPSVGSITLTFDAQANDLDIIVRVS